MNTLFKKVFETTQVDFFDNKNDIEVTSINDNSTIIFESHLNYVENRKKFKYISTVKNDQDVFIKNYGNPFCSVFISRKTIVIEENEQKISLKIFHFNKRRKRSEVFFRKESLLRFVTYDKVRNEIFSGSLRNHHKKRKKIGTLRRNNFIKKPFEVLFSEIHNSIGFFAGMDKVDDEKFMNELKSKLYNSIGFNPSEYSSLNDFLYKKYLEFKGVKYPNNYNVFHNVIPLITKRELKKSKLKLVDAVMNRFGMKGDKIRKILHQINHFNTYTLKSVIEFFGADYINQKDEKFLKNLFEQQNVYFTFNPYSVEVFSKVEKNNCFQLFELLLDGKIEIYTFLDHLNFYNKIKKYENIKWNSKTYAEFLREHLEWSEKVEYYTRATYERIYDQLFVDELEKEIDYCGVKYYPVILKKSKDYIEESSHQNNCVRTYVDRASSFIVSYRKGSPDSKERATIEYKIRKRKNDMIGLFRVQTLGRFNKNLTEEWDSPIELLDEIIFDNIESLKNISIKKITAIETNIIDGHFTDDNNELVWKLPIYDNIDF